MLDLLNPPQPPSLGAQHYAGPERRSTTSPLITRWFTQMLDEIDYGMLLVVDETQVVHVNHAARRALDEDHPLQLLGHELRVRRARDLAPLHQALANAARRGLRSLLALGDEGQRVCVAVVPLAALDNPCHASLLMFGKQNVCEALSVQSFARAHRLTLAETQVLTRLCSGEQPSDIATQQGVALSTVRTQIGSIRTKTGAQSIRDLVRQIAVLPPLVSSLRATQWLAQESAAAWARAC